MYKPNDVLFLNYVFGDKFHCPEAYDKICEETESVEESDVEALNFEELFHFSEKNSRFPEDFPRNKRKGVIRLAAANRFRGQRGKRGRGDDSRTIKTNNVKSLDRHSPSKSMIITSGIEEFYQGNQII